MNNTPNPKNTLLTVRETAERLSLSKQTVYVLINSGQLRSVSIGRARRIPESAIEEFIHMLERDAGWGETG